MTDRALKANFSVANIDVFDNISINKAFKCLLESRAVDEKRAKNCLSIQMHYDPKNPVSDLSLIMQNNCNLILYMNFDTIFTLGSKIATAVFKEDIETSYYTEFAKAALSKIDQYIQYGISYAVMLYCYK